MQAPALQLSLPFKISSPLATTRLGPSSPPPASRNIQSPLLPQSKRTYRLYPCKRRFSSSLYFLKCQRRWLLHDLAQAHRLPHREIFNRPCCHNQRSLGSTTQRYQLHQAQSKTESYKATPFSWHTRDPRRPTTTNAQRSLQPCVPHCTKVTRQIYANQSGQFLVTSTSGMS